MQWSAEPFAGFSTERPWFYVNENYREVNVAAEEADEDSLLNFYRALIAFKRTDAAAIWGSYTEHCQQSDNFYVYSREYEGERLLVICSFSDKEHYFTAPAGFDLAEGELIFKNYELNVAVGNAFATRPYELRVYRFAADGKGDAQ